MTRPIVAGVDGSAPSIGSLRLGPAPRYPIRAPNADGMLDKLAASIRGAHPSLAVKARQVRASWRVSPSSMPATRTAPRRQDLALA